MKERVRERVRESKIECERERLGKISLGMFLWLQIHFLGKRFNQTLSSKIVWSK